MKKNLVNRINNEKENYESAWNGLSRSEWNRKLDYAWKKIRMDYQYDSMKNFADYNLGTERYYSLDERPSLKKNERPTYESYKRMVMEGKESMICGLIAVYTAASERISSRSFWDKVFHPIDTYRENKSYAELKETMTNFGITDEVLEDYRKSEDSVTIDEAVRFSREIETEDAKPEMEEFVNRNSAARIDAIYLV